MGTSIDTDILKELGYEDKVEKFKTAAFQEYIDMISGEKVFSRASDIREYRLFLLIKHVFEGEIPTERKVAELFQIKQSEARTMLRNVEAKYRRQLQTLFNDYLKKIVDSIKTEEAPYKFKCDSSIIIEHLNEILFNSKVNNSEGVEGAMKIIQKVPFTSNQYIINESSLNAIKAELNGTK